MKRILVVGVVTVSLLVLLFAVWNAWATRQLGRTIREQAEQGIPMRFSDVVPADVPAEHNAAPILIAVFKLMCAGGPEAGRYNPVVQDLLGYGIPLLPPAQPLAGTDVRGLPAEQKAELRAKLQNPDVEAVFAALLASASKSRCRFEIDYSQGAGMLLPHLTHIRNGARLLALRAWLEADAGKGAEALRDLRAAFRIGGFLREEPILISQLVRVACNGIALASTRDIIERWGSTLVEADVSALTAEILAQTDVDNEGLIRALDGERVLLGKWAFDRLLTGQMPQHELRGLGFPRGVWLYFRPPGRPLLKTDFRCYLDVMAAYRERAALPVAEAPVLGPRVDSLPWYCMLSRLMLPALEKSFERMAADRASMSLARVGLALVGHLRQTGSYPVTLAGIKTGDPLPRDPFSGADFVFRPAEKGYLLYSVGANRRDDGGAGDDVAWRIGS